MLPGNAYLALYAVFLVSRVNGCIRRGRQPLLRGRQWFFNVPVGMEFYRGSGARLLRGYWLRMLVPFAVELPVAAYLIASGRPSVLAWLILALCALIHLNHHYSVAFAVRQARRLASAEPQATSTIVAPVVRRSLNEYSSRPAEWIVGLSIAIATGCLIHHYDTSPGRYDPRFVFGAPVLCLYVHIGLILLKRYVVHWSAPIPGAYTSEYFECVERTRRFYARMVDWCRIFFTVPILIWPAVLAVSASSAQLLLQVWFLSAMSWSIVLALWVEFQRKALVATALEAPPIVVPDPLNQSNLAPWPLCFQPAAPAMILKGARGNSLNFAHVNVAIGAAYLAGMSVLVVLLHS